MLHSGHELRIPEEIRNTKCTPWNDSLFKVTSESPKLSEEKNENFHTFVACFW